MPLRSASSKLGQVSDGEPSNNVSRLLQAETFPCRTAATACGDMGHMGNEELGEGGNDLFVQGSWLHVHMRFICA
jgi:hypothetical protein